MGGRGASSGSASVGLAALAKQKPYYRRNSNGHKWNPTLIRTPLLRDGDIVGADRKWHALTSEEWQGGRYTTVDPSALHSLQGWVDSRGVRNALTHENSHDDSSDVPLAVQVGDEYWIVDGNHRAAAAKLSGRKRMRIKVLG